MKLNKKNFLFGTAIIALVAVMLGLAFRTKSMPASPAAHPSVHAKKEPAAASTDLVVRAQNAPAPTSVTASEKPAIQIATLPTPSPTDRPYIRMQINPEGTLEGIFATRCEPVKQARSPQPVDGYYYRLVSPATGETLIDGTVAKPVIRHQHRGVDEHGVAYVVCPTEPLNGPVFFDIPNIAARLEVYTATPSSPLAAKYLPLINAVDLSPR